MQIIAIIPARGGSRRIPGKNIKSFNGKPIIAYSIEKAFASGLFDRVIVSTDSEKIAQLVKLYGAEVYMRDPDYGLDCVGTQSVMCECLLGLGIDVSNTIACCIYATAPLMDVSQLREGFNVLMGTGGTTFVFSVGYPPLHDVGQFYWGRAMDFCNGKPLIGPYSRMILVPESRDCDINTYADWNRAEVKYKLLEKKTK